MGRSGGSGEEKLEVLREEIATSPWERKSHYDWMADEYDSDTDEEDLKTVSSESGGASSYYTDEGDL